MNVLTHNDNNMGQWDWQQWGQNTMIYITHIEYIFNGVTQIISHTHTMISHNNNNTTIVINIEWPIIADIELYHTQ